MKQVLLMSFAFMFFSCEQTEKPDYSILSGTVENMEAASVYVRGGDITKEIEIDGQTFSDTIFLKGEGFFELFIEGRATKIYLENGKNLDVTIDAQQPENLFSFENDLKEINNFLFHKESWTREHVNPEVVLSMDEATFKETLEKNEEELNELFASYNISDKKFKENLARENKYFEMVLVENYEGGYRYFNQDPTFTVSENFYDLGSKFDFTDTLAFKNSSMYQDLVETHYGRVANNQAESENGDFNLTYLQLIDKNFPNGYAKNKLMFDHLRYGLSPNENLETVYEIYKNSNPDSKNLEEISTRYALLKTILPGNASPKFDYENFKGGTVSLSDLSGKYVYIDVWATWCGPCLNEIPFLQEVEKDYEGKNIQVVSISIDVERDYDKWRNMVETKSLGGLQLMADNNWQSKFVEDYGILGIPRFILVDPEGNIVQADAPRPSDPELRTLLDELL